MDNPNDKSFNEYIDIHLNDLEKILKEFQIDDNDFNHFKKLFDNHVDENRRYFNISNILLSSEFNFFELNLSDNFKVNFYGKNDDCEFSHEMLFNENRLGARIAKGYLNCLNIEEVVYIDFPSIFEHDNYQNPIRLEKLPYHLRYLSRLLTHKKEIDVFDMEDNEDLNSISELIKDMLGGFIYFDDKKNEFMFKKGDQKYCEKHRCRSKTIGNNSGVIG